MEELSKHLTQKEMENFMNLKRLSKDSMGLIARVNGHLIHCEKCKDIFEDYKVKYKSNSYKNVR